MLAAAVAVDTKCAATRQDAKRPNELMVRDCESVARTRTNERAEMQSISYAITAKRKSANGIVAEC